MYKIASILFIITTLSVASAQANTLIFNTQDFPPFNYEINNVVEGPAAEVIRTVCDMQGFSCKFNLLPWRRAQNEVKNGNANAMFVIGWNKARAEWLYYSPPLMQTEYGFFVRKNNNLTYLDSKDIAGYKIGVFGPSNTSNSLNKIKESMASKGIKPIDIKMVSDDVNIFKMLDDPNRNLKGVYSNKDVGLAIINQVKLKNIRYAGAQKKLKYFIGFSKKYTDKKLVDKFNHGLTELHKSGKLQEILSKFHMEAASLE
ncbi:substrate-binding periplasmic protein [Spartinivicinus poritis]|uniref:Transporter substrate-binding domain-containing protein n=1 Tax=Spartinivicinus poritis TaxID=2994640 RepID=A0ABT5UFT5_9GAMM|nr:transporter substrate-binding domain-containing protein [Spartinivicinus sp. A2-2]MDE1465250.1 transporter substrate-binding domain-containing protein [Spartinivicinus sp. A2-2]